MTGSLTFTPDDLEAFPFVDDFLVRLVDAGEANLQVEFASSARGRLAGFPGWDHADRDLRHFIPSDMPLGTIVEPYDDRDEGWRIVIFEHGGWMYIAEGDDANAAELSTRFRVRLERYLQAWAALIDLYNPITPLDDTTDDPS